MWVRVGYISNEVICRRTDQPPLTHNHSYILNFFSQMHYNPCMDHSWVISSSVAPISRDWNRRSGRPRQTWLCTVESDVTPHSTLVWQLAIIEHKIDRHVGRSWKRQRPLDKPRDDDDDDNGCIHTCNCRRQQLWWQTTQLHIWKLQRQLQLQCLHSVNITHTVVDRFTNTRQRQYSEVYKHTVSKEISNGGKLIIRPSYCSTGSCSWKRDATLHHLVSLHSHWVDWREFWHTRKSSHFRSHYHVYSSHSRSHFWHTYVPIQLHSRGNFTGKGNSIPMHISTRNMGHVEKSIIVQCSCFSTQPVDETWT